MLPPESIFSGRPLSRSERVQLSLLIGVAAGCLAYLAFLRRPEMLARDFTYPLRGAHALLAGGDPYRDIRPSGPPPFDMWFMYPLTAAMAALPFTAFSMQLGGALFAALGAAALAFALSREGLSRFWLFLSPPFLLAVILAQWSPLLIAGTLLTPLGWVLSCKPTIGAALFAYRPNWRTAAVAGAFVVISLLLRPDWPLEWLGAARTVREHYIPATRLFGGVALLALLRWRKPEARLVAAMALVPQNLYFYDQLPLLVIARSGMTQLSLTALSWLAWAGTRLTCPSSDFCGPEAEPWIIGLVYLPAALLVIIGDDGLTLLRQRARRLLSNER